MAFDGFFYKKHFARLNELIINAKIEKVYQINTYDLLLTLKSDKSIHLLLSTHPSHARIEIIENKPEMPDEPPMFCMLLRKHLTSGIIQKIEQIGYERIAILHITTVNQIGEVTPLKLIIEIMGKHSNLILAKQDNIMIEAIKRIGASMSPRIIAPGYTYELPPSKKIALDNLTLEVFKEALKTQDTSLSKALYTTFEGYSPASANVLIEIAELDEHIVISELSDNQFTLLFNAQNHLLKYLNDKNMYIYMGKYHIDELSAIPLKKPSETIIEDYMPYFNRYFSERKASNQIKSRSSSLIKTLQTKIDKLKTKVKHLNNDVKKASNLMTYKLNGELLTANLHAIKKGDETITVLNYYDNTETTIKLNPKKTPNDNAQHYYKRYHKAKVTLEKAELLKNQAISEIDYLKQVISMLEQAESLDDIMEIRNELSEGGFIKNRSYKRTKRHQKLPPFHYKSFEGVDIFVGRNNYQNDELTLKKSNKEHIWLHTKDIHGAHVVIAAEFKDIQDQTLIEAAEIAAYHSNARYSAQVPVDLTEIKFVKKAKGARPGMVIYDDNKTIYVNPDPEKIQSRKAEKCK